MIYTIKLRRFGAWTWRRVKVRAHKIRATHRENHMNYEVTPHLELVLPNGMIRRIPNIYSDWEFEAPLSTEIAQLQPVPQQAQG